MKLLRTHLSRRPDEWSFPVTGFVLLVLLGISLLYWTHSSEFSFLTAGREAIFQNHQYWRLFTTIAVHADIHHFLANGIFFLIFGFLLHSYFGPWVFPIMSLAMGGVTNYLTLYFYPEHSTLVGASGVVYYMAGFWATLFFFIERKDRALKRMGVTLCVSTMLFFPTSYEPHVSYLAHGWGFALGILCGILYFYRHQSDLRKAEVWKEPESDENPQLSTSTDPMFESVDRPSNIGTI